jgi:hypothetical protein
MRCAAIGRSGRRRGTTDSTFRTLLLLFSIFPILSSAEWGLAIHGLNPSSGSKPLGSAYCRAFDIEHTFYGEYCNTSASPL